MSDVTRVWLEPGYDYGRTGAWMLEWPGCFVWARDREAALARAPSAAGGFVDWLIDHGEDAAFSASAETEVIEEVPVSRVDGYERMATFERDRAALPEDELEAAIRRLAYTRADLLALAERVDQHEATHGPLPAGEEDLSGREGGDAATPPRVTTVRSAAEVLHHVALTDVWLTSRVERSERYEGPPRDGPLRPYLDGTRAWTVDRLRALQRHDAVMATTDRMGEDWTVAKVVRRLVYHGLDHLRELERRLWEADGSAQRLAFQRDASVGLEELARLLSAGGLGARVRDRERLAQMLAGSTHVFTVRDGPKLVGFARTISDDAFNAYVSSVVVHPRWQGRGIGTRLMREVMRDAETISYVLHARDGVHDFYRSLGFAQQSGLMYRRRTR